MNHWLKATHVLSLPINRSAETVLGKLLRSLKFAPRRYSALRAGGEGGNTAPATRRFTLCAASILILCGCASHPRIGQTPPATNTVELRSQSKVVFDRARLYKPAESNVDSPAFKLAPLFMQAVHDSAGTNDDTPDGFTRLKLKRTQNPDASTGPTVYYCTNTVSLNGNLHAQVWFFWFYCGETTGNAPRHWLCVTLDHNGKPAIWQIPPRARELSRCFVSEGLEAAAGKNSGGPLPGRSLSVETDIHENPHAVVAGVMNDAPVAMGPIIHLREGTHEISAVVCRCAPPQVRKLAGAATYELVPIEEVAWPSGKAMLNRTGALHHRDSADNRIDRLLRLPRDF
jgi:hypothetical protein